MNKFLKCSIMAATILSLTGCSGGEDKPTLKVFNWGEYMDLNLLEEFESEFDCEVVYETFDTNESMYAKLQGGNDYDILVPSEYMIERLIKEDLVQKIDMEQIPNMENIDPEILGQSFDPKNEYWVPYFSGNVGILYDSTVIDEADLEAGWDVLLNEKYAGNLYMYDSVRDSFLPALKSLGYSMNTTNETEIKEAYEWLANQKETMDPVYVGDEVIDSMVRGEKAMAVMYSGDAAYVQTENEDMKFFMPEEGTNFWFDGMVMTKTCEQTELATAFMNFMSSNDSALANTNEVGYFTTNVNAASEAKEADYSDISSYGIRYGEKDERFTYQDDATIEMYNEYWERIITMS